MGSWVATGLPGLRRSLVHAHQEEAARVEALADRADAVVAGQYASVFRRAARFSTELGDALRSAGLYWVGREMGRVALDASQDVPVIDPADAPAAAGLMCFADRMPRFDASAEGGLALRVGDRPAVDYPHPVPVDAVVWAAGGGRLSVWPCVRSHRLPGQLYGVRVDLTAFTRLSVAAPLPLDVVDPSLVRASRDAVGLLSLLSSCWVLMTAPAVAEQRLVDARTGALAVPETGRSRTVVVVDLRPARYRYVPAMHDASGRRLTRRHVVRGHWTHQPYGPGGSLRRLQWVDSYVRGPEGAPLDRRDRVYAWRHP